MCTSLLYHQYQKLKCRPGLLFKIYLYSQEATNLCNEITLNQDFGNQLHNQFMIIKRTIGSLFYSHSQHTRVLHDLFLNFLSNIITSQSQRYFPFPEHFQINIPILLSLYMIFFYIKYMICSLTFHILHFQKLFLEISGPQSIQWNLCTFSGILPLNKRREADKHKSEQQWTE